jgi:transcriptional regulator with XRE-family HTH domain
MNGNANGDTGGLRERRLAAGLTQQELAQRARCSISSVHLYEKGMRPSYSDVLPRIEKALESAPKEVNTGRGPSS